MLSAKKIDQEVIQEPGASNNGKGKSDNVSVPKNKKSDPGKLNILALKFFISYVSIIKVIERFCSIIDI